VITSVTAVTPKIETRHPDHIINIPRGKGDITY